MLRFSIRSKILLGFVVVLLTFGVATAYGVWAVHTLGQQLRLVALGYSNLRLELQDQQTMQANLQRRLHERRPEHVAGLLEEVAADRKLRRLRLDTTRQHVDELRRSLSREDAVFLDVHIATKLATLAALYETTERAPRSAAGPEEEQVARLLQELSQQLTGKVIEVVNTGSRHEARAGFLTMGLSLWASLCSAVVLWMVQATLRPLRRLAESAKEVARGNYKQRVLVDSVDEVGVLGREFNAMAAALAERELRLRRTEQLAAVGKMAAQITHEIRNPLTSIGLHAELLADEVVAGNAEAEKIAKAICKEVDRLTDITEEYLRFARLPQPRLEAVDVNALLGGLSTFLKEELGRRGVVLSLKLGQGLPRASADDNQLRQVLLNLIRNAAEAMADQPAQLRTLCLMTRTLLEKSGANEPPTDAPMLAIDVIDDGPGVLETQQRQIFEPFFSTKPGGTGLGLALCVETIARHGGKIVLESPVAHGRGARFTVELKTRTEKVPTGLGQTGEGP